jgi:UDP-sugar transporter A1/2/3
MGIKEIFRNSCGLWCGLLLLLPIAILCQLHHIKSLNGLLEAQHAILRKEPISKSKVPNEDESSTDDSIISLIFFILLCFQTGCQPVLVQAFTPTTVVRSTAILAQECVKLFVSFFFLFSSGNWAKATHAWTFTSAVLAAGLPAALYVIQNYCNLMANQYLPPVTFSVLNQTKNLSAAFFCFVLLAKPQSFMQIMALNLLVYAALIMQKVIPINFWQSSDGGKLKQKESKVVPGVEEDEDPERKVEGDDWRQAEAREADNENTEKLTKGVFPALFASLLSGLAGTLAQNSLQVRQRSPHVFNIELGFFSSFFLVASLLLGSPDCRKLKEGGVKQGWTWKTWIPIVNSAWGGILVGLVTQKFGAVRKGFALIFGMLISAFLQQVFLSKKGGGVVTREQIAGMILGAISLWMHCSYPPEEQIS